MTNITVFPTHWPICVGAPQNQDQLAHIVCFFFFFALLKNAMYLFDCISFALPSVHTSCVSTKTTSSVEILWKLDIWCRRLVKVTSLQKFHMLASNCHSIWSWINYNQQYSKRRTLPDGGGKMSSVFPHYQSFQELFCAILQTSTRTEHILSAVGNICSQKMVILSEDHVEAYLPLLSQSVDHRGWEHRMHFSIPAILCISSEFRVRIVLIYLIKGQPL